MAGREPKPLSKAARDRVLKIAREHKALGEVLKGRARPVVIASYPEAREGGQGQALVGVYDYDRDRTPRGHDRPWPRAGALARAGAGPVPVERRGAQGGCR